MSIEVSDQDGDSTEGAGSVSYGRRTGWTDKALDTVPTARTAMKPTLAIQPTIRDRNKTAVMSLEPVAPLGKESSMV